MKQLALIIFVMSLVKTPAQVQVYTHSNLSGDTVWIKWYHPDLIADEITIFKSENNGDWKPTFNQKNPFGKSEITARELKQDAQLPDYLQMTKHKENIKELVKIATLLKSFESKPLCRHLGIMYSDTEIRKGKKYSYKIEFTSSLKKETGISAALVPGKEPKAFPPSDIIIRAGKNAALIGWKREPLRYYGVNVYRRHKDSATAHKLNIMPVMLSGEARKVDGIEIMFADNSVLEEHEYVYQLEGIDFFGQVTEKSRETRFRMPDKNAPPAPSQLRLTSSAYRVRCSWHQEKVPDLAGFNIYRTHKNDTDYFRLNSQLIQADKTEFVDSVNSFQSYAYQVSAVDKSGNESRSVPTLVEVADFVPPAVPRGLRARGDSGRILLQWEKGREKDLAGYFIYRNISGAPDDGFLKVNALPVVHNQFTDELPAKASNHFIYKIVAVDQSLNRSAYSGTVSAQMKDFNPPSRPFLYQDARRPGTLLWYRNPEPDLHQYILYKRSNRDSLFTRFVNPAPSDTSYEISTNDEAGSMYRMVAVDNSGLNSPPSSIIYFPPHPNKKKQVTVACKSIVDLISNSVKVQWKLSGDVSDKDYGAAVYRRSPGDKIFSLVQPLTRESSFVDQPDQDSAEYEYQVRYYSQSGDISHSDIMKIQLNKQAEYEK